MAASRALEIWKRLTPEERDYDRLVPGRIPRGAPSYPETEGGKQLLREREITANNNFESSGCSCHIAAPCSFCCREYDDNYLEDGESTLRK